MHNANFYHCNTYMSTWVGIYWLPLYSMIPTLYLKVWDAASVAHAGEWLCCFTVIKLFHVRSEDQGGAFTAHGFVERQRGISSSNIVSKALRGHQLQDVLNNHALVTDLTHHHHHHHHQEVRRFCSASPPCGHRAADVAATLIIQCSSVSSLI